MMEVKLKSPCNCFPPPPPYSADEPNQQPAGGRPPPLSAQLPQQQAATATPPQVQQPQHSTVRKLITLIFCFLLPPISVALHNGPYKTINLTLNIVWYLNGWMAVWMSRPLILINLRYGPNYFPISQIIFCIIIWMPAVIHALINRKFQKSVPWSLRFTNDHGV